MDDMYFAKDGMDLQRDMLRYSVDSYIKFSLHLEDDTRLPVGPNDIVIILPAIHPDDEERDRIEQEQISQQRKAA